MGVERASIEMAEKVPIVFASDDYFVPYMAVMIASIIANATDERLYELIIFHRRITPESQRRLEEMLRDHTQFSMRFVDVSSYIDKYELYTANRMFFSAEAYYRLLAPFILTEYKKAIYLDGDMVAIKDIAALMDIDMQDYLVAAVRDYCGLSDLYNPQTVRRAYMENELHLTKPDNYYISALLVMNLEKFRKVFTEKQMMEFASSRQWKYHDQDVLNILTQGRTLLLDARWNVLQDYGMHHFLPPHYYCEWEVSYKDPYIVHYGGEGKPWRFPRIPRRQYFWKYAALTPFLGVIRARKKMELKENRLYRIKYVIQFFLPLGSRTREMVKRCTKRGWEWLKEWVGKND